ncbi:hypothetical protein A2641_01670 [Candidatus Nomurabacteria bacterium RIFCSPHIGHO2_01_FULL_37_25]|uniref:Uncharacterized protein n=1 Tax=Candidatus Nomurabacteria bacterium RIFCSPLOWO2_01_FULL_36_16 TaxID=1801767 RepID=A0A1F6WXU3_9BACT|nr:MAG: hypothetical protein A2641_01670 [Candidatus Nomurabacteria bacterium RIFCSPHIGHO2_01_FULL_37_25]OGI74984.1 MAG: hypothetical protein A3D36_00550 [Candidatus Nomurabacteria bacterium RIFCSPHIGHO2_02_FULL_36_29]OGI86690.1 MAG: hypothetical protein A3A91_03575 [Candidatus Nomurabacteria bacterium RIFCSPLOWO2_01_FULL_36_16]OGI96419.1 MAG: hypothetical protein A3I84_02945 [Candidatus Nomurabacteria bacterium RIFCSPLOWO2_02_FULL_36_8]
MNEILKCPKCNGDMIRGFIPDFANNFVKASSWFEGQPQKSYWNSFIKISWKGWFGKVGIPIAGFCCKGCGFIEIYSDPGFAAK